ncbi:hypothetical protein CVS40_4606 [Lucilia cuprina]|nr:hypothetical protein CVS40_4606 [Lucilia cuprina]
MEKSENSNLLTVQEVMTPVPAAECSERAGYPSSSSSVCNVTPVTSLAGTTDNATSKNENAENSAPQRKPVDKSAPPTQIEARKYPDQKPDSFTELGDLIVDLLDFFKDKNNIHLAIKWQVRKMRSVYNKAKDEIYRDTTKSCGVIADKVTQTSPLVWPKKREEKRKKDKSENSAKLPTPKRAKNNPQLASGKGPVFVSTEVSSKNNPPSEDQQTTSEGWTKVRNRKTKRFRKPQPDKMIISSKGETSYADILRKIRTDPELKELGEEVSKIRRTQN